MPEPAYAARDAVTDRDAGALPRERLAMTPAEFSPAFKRSQMERATLRGLKRNAAVVLGNVGTADDVALLTTASHHTEPLVREHAAWTLSRLGERTKEAHPTGDASPRIPS